MTKKKRESFEQKLERLRQEALAESKKKRREAEATRPRIVIETKQGLTEGPAKETDKKLTTEMPAVDESRLRTQAADGDGEKKHCEDVDLTAKTRQAEAIDEEALLAQAAAQAAEEQRKKDREKPAAAVSDAAAEHDDELEELQALLRADEPQLEKVEVIDLSERTTEETVALPSGPGKPLDEPPTRLDEKAVTEEEAAAAQRQEPPTRLAEKAVTEEEAAAAQRQEPPTVTHEAAISEEEAAAGLGVVSEEGDLSVLEELEEEELGRRGQKRVGKIGKLIDDALSESKESKKPVVTEEEAPRHTVDMTETTERTKETEKKGGISKWLKYYASEVVMVVGTVAVSAVVGTSEWIGQLLGNLHTRLVVGAFICVMAVVVAFSASFKSNEKRRAEWLRERDKIERGEK